MGDVPNIESAEACVDFVETEFARLPWTKGLEAATKQAILADAKVVTFGADQLIQDVGQPVDRVLFVFSGTFRVQLMDHLGNERYRGIVGRGGAIGLLTIASRESSRIKVQTIEPCIAISLTFDQILDFGSRSKAFQRAMLELSASLFVRVSSAERKLTIPSVVAIVHLSAKTAAVTSWLANRLKALDEEPCVLSDLPLAGLEEDIAFKSLLDGEQCIPASERRATIKEWASRGRLILNLTAPHVGEDLVAFLNYADRILWCVGEGEEELALRWITELHASASWVKEKLAIVWVLEKQRVAPWVPQLMSLAARDFKLTLSKPLEHEGVQLSGGLERIVHSLRGIQVGLALGGGAARGMAHLGVLQALESQGIIIDRIAGTSAGAMTGTVYSLGFEPQYATHCFKTDLLPSWFFRQLPGGGYWYLIHKYRRGLFDPMLRKYLHDYRLEQLPIPMTTVSVDLVDGEPCITSTGDATHAILDSINLPPLSLPIIRGQRAIVDGGLLNNVPANVLVSQGCNFVIASTVTANLERDFMAIRKSGQPRRRLFFDTLQVLMRQSLVQSYNMNAVGVSPADFVIATDVTRFDISEFTRADEMAVIGNETTLNKIASLKQQLQLLDKGLFQ